MNPSGVAVASNPGFCASPSLSTLPSSVAERATFTHTVALGTSAARSAAPPPTRPTVPQLAGRLAVFDAIRVDAGSVVMLGDSLTATAEWAEFFPGTPIINRGVNGDTTHSVLERVRSYLPGGPSSVFLLVGINDLNMGYSVAETSDRYAKIVAVVRSESPHTRLFLQAVMPCLRTKGRLATLEAIEDLNTRIEAIARSNSATFIDSYSAFLSASGLPEPTFFLDDGLHLSTRGYHQWIRVLSDYL